MPVPSLVLAAWIAFGAGGAELRVVVPSASQCAGLQAKADSAPLVLVQRSAPDEAFPIRVCAAQIPAEARAVQVEDRRLKAPVSRPQRIVLIGDTGCRMKGASLQACNDPTAWPFAALAASAARENPDLVVHVGDYHYRETPCPAQEAGCKGSPWGDSWRTWAADFFDPASPLLAAAPWVTMRGNHEDCHRAGHGWTVMLDPEAVPPSGCNPGDSPYHVDLGNLGLLVVDDNDADDFRVNEDAAKRLRGSFQAIPADHPVWLMTHHPWHGVAKAAMGFAEGANATLAKAWDRPFPANVALTVSGHIHVLQVENFESDHPPQLIVGGGGDQLDFGIPTDLAGLDVGGWRIRDGNSLSAFGYAVLDRTLDGWTLTAHKPDGGVLERCVIGPGRIDCLTGLL